ncbi:coiled-coil domain-containing protein [Geminocystis sp.]|uniref:coiled-coil domain-containing protein n=1 Tax=Geminocystis sp. TaxID=2664100 RepID=UPI0035944243
MLNNQEIINNWETIKDLIYLIDNEKVTIDNTVKFAYIFQNQFLVSNLKCLNKIINFIKNTGISKNELVSIVEKGNISQIREKINILQEKLSKKEQEINSKENEINTTNKQLRKLESQVQQFRDEAKKIRNELDYFLEARK